MPVVGVPVVRATLTETSVEPPVAQRVAPVVLEWVPLVLLLGLLLYVTAPQTRAWPLAVLLLLALWLLL